jgi:hypothetical protein
MLATRSRLATLVALGVLGCETFTEVLGPIPYTATLTGASIRPAGVTTEASGTLAAALDQATLQWSYTVGWEDLSSVPTGVHLHGPADAATVGELLAELNTADTELAVTSAATGVLDLGVVVRLPIGGDSLRKLLDAGQVYVDVHTLNNPEGEIRGQLIRH